MKRFVLSFLVMCLIFTGAVALAEDEKPEEFTEGDYTYIILEDGTAKITGYRGSDADLSIPDSLGGIKVSQIGDYAFFWHSNLTSVVFPDSVTCADKNPFEYCKKLNSITVSPNHPALAVIDGVLFSKVDKRLICYPMGKTGDTYCIPQGISIVGEYAFSQCESLINITISDSVTTIGEGAFNLCSSLTSVTIPNSVISIGKLAFSSCSSLTSVTIPNSVTSIGDEAFASCWGLTSVAIPDSVINIGEIPFGDCKELTSINVSPNHPTLAVIDGVLFSKVDKRLICYPMGKEGNSYTIPQGIAKIGMGAFFSCSILNNVIIPDSVISIEVGAFYGCSNLANLTISDNTTEIGENAFANCPNLTLTVGHDSYAEKYCIDNGLTYIYPDSLDWLNS